MNTDENVLIVRPLQSQDETAWRVLFRGYADFYKVPMNDTILATTWSWLMSEGHPLEGLLACQGAKPVGFAHFRAQPKPLLGEDAGFLDDLFVEPSFRGSGAATKLIRELGEIALERGWSTVRWITAEDNAVARKLYDRLASLTSWKTYELKS